MRGTLCEHHDLFDEALRSKHNLKSRNSRKKASSSLLTSARCDSFIRARETARRAEPASRTTAVIGAVIGLLDARSAARRRATRSRSYASRNARCSDVSDARRSRARWAPYAQSHRIESSKRRPHQNQQCVQVPQSETVRNLPLIAPPVLLASAARQNRI